MTAVVGFFILGIKMIRFYKTGDERLVKITGSKDLLLWYQPYVGMTWEIIGEEDDFYWAREPAGYKNIIYKEDCELV